MPSWIVKLFLPMVEKFVQIVALKVSEWLLVKLKNFFQILIARVLEKVHERKAKADEELRKAREAADPVATAVAEAVVASADSEEAIIADLLQAVVDGIDDITSQLPEAVEQIVHDMTERTRKQSLLPSAKDLKALEKE
jgi:hypothetical protein